MLEGDRLRIEPRLAIGHGVEPVDRLAILEGDRSRWTWLTTRLRETTRLRGKMPGFSRVT